MGDLVEQWGAESRSAKYGFSRVGAVTGATYPEDLRKLRQQMPHTFFLVPGYGAQGEMCIRDSASPAPQSADTPAG